MSRDQDLARYEAGPADLQAVLAGLSEADLDLAQAEGEWTIRQIVHHLAQGDPLWTAFAEAAIGNPGCAVVLSWYTTNEAWAEALHTAERPVEEALALFQANRRYTVELLRHMPEAWERGVVIRGPEAFGGQEIKVGQIVAMLADHIQEHVAQIRAVRQAHGR